MTIKSNHLKVRTLGPVGRKLCWAESGYAVGEFYAPGTLGRFCEFLAKIRGKDCCAGVTGDSVLIGCDQTGNFQDALRVAAVRSAPAGNDLHSVRSELAAGRPLILKKSGPAAHIYLVVGLTAAGTVDGVELIDPIGADFRQLYLWGLYAKLLKYSNFKQFKTEPETLSPTPPELGETIWAGALTAAVPFKEVQLIPDLSGMQSALADFALSTDLTLVDQEQVAMFPLKLKIWEQMEVEVASDFSNLEACRCLLRTVGSKSTLAVDIFKIDNKFAVGRLSSGRLVDRRVSELKSKLEGGGLELASSLHFVEFVDLGLDLSCYGPPGSSTWVLPFGPRDYQAFEKTESTELGYTIFKDRLRKILE